MPQNTVVRSGVNNYAIPELGYDLSSPKVGDVFTEKGFLSTAVHRNKGFQQDYNLVICVPKGANGFYAEPYSAFCFGGRNWNGKDITPLQNEVEVILQSPPHDFELSKPSINKNGQWFIDMEVIGQPTF